MREPIRRKSPRRRLVASAVEPAAAMIGRIQQGEEITGLTNGQFSLIDIIEHLLNQTGPADVIISTWTMGIYDQDRAAKFCANGQIRSIRWLVDPSMFSRRPELAGRLIEAFGAESFRAVNTHAKFAVIEGNDLRVCVRSSMNLNPNKRFENFDISADTEMCAWFRSIADSAFTHVGEDNTSQSESIFSGILREYETMGPGERDAKVSALFGQRANPFAAAG